MIGFVIISHREPAQLMRLIATLNRLYDDPPIACHHDLSQAPLDRGAFPANVRFVLPSVETRWAKWPVIEGVLRAIRLLYDHASPEWFVLLSAADYPIAPPGEVLAELKQSDVDAFIDFRIVGQNEGQASAQFGARNPRLWLSETAKGRRLGWHRYLSAQFWLPIPRRKPGGGYRLGKASFHPPFKALNSPYTRDFRCFFGDFWFTANRRAAAVLLNPSRKHRRLQRYLSLRTFPEECYFQSVLCNEPELRLDRNHKRFCIWEEGANHPKELGRNDLPELLASGDHFARKFRSDDPVLSALDAALAGAAFPVTRQG